jgi:glutathione S-transferase
VSTALLTAEPAARYSDRRRKTVVRIFYAPNEPLYDDPAGSLTPRWFNWTPREALPAHPNVRSWYERLAARPAYQEHVIKVNAKRTQGIAERG